jgi:mono/diheme cytochrome c family protein
MNVTLQKLLVGFLGLALFFSVMTVGYVDRKRREEKKMQLAPQAMLDPKFEKGRKLYEKLSCLACHGADGKSGAFNLNAQTGQQVPPVAFVADSFTKDEVKEKILKGVKEVQKLDPAGPVPPLYMPAYQGMISETEMNDIINYLYSLMPEEKKEAW